MSSNSRSQSIDAFLADRARAKLERQEADARLAAWGKRRDSLLAATRLATDFGSDWWNVKGAGRAALDGWDGYALWTARVLVALARVLRDDDKWLTAFKALKATRETDYPRGVKLLDLALSLGGDDEDGIAKLAEVVRILHDEEAGTELPQATLGGELGAIIQALITVDRRLSFGGWPEDWPALDDDVEGTMGMPGGGKIGNKAPRRTVNARMLEESQRRPESCGWTARTWADFLGCSPSTVTDAYAWKEWEAARFQLKQARRKDKRRRPNKLNQRDDD